MTRARSLVLVTAVLAPVAVSAVLYLLASTSAVRRPDLEQRQVAVTLAEQAGAALAAAPRSTTS